MAPSSSLPPHSLPRFAAAEQVAERSLPLLLFAAIFVFCLAPFHSGLPWMVYMQDDFFYYLKVAENLAAGHGSTFNGIASTNGYHPLWFLLLAGLSSISTSPRAILAFLAVTNFTAAVATFLCARQLLRSTGIRPLTALAFAVWITLYSLRLFYYGMEVTLAIPLALGLLVLLENTAFWQRGLRQSFLLGLLASAMILARLDTLLLAGLLALFGLLQPELRRRLGRPHILGILLGLLPVALYLASNQVFFHLWLPVSGMAKQLKFNHHPTLRTWQGLYLQIPSFFLVFLPIPLGLLLFPFVAGRLPAIKRAIYPAALLFPLLYFFVLCCLSDWTIWGWYLYALRPAVCAAFAVFCCWPPLARLLRTTAVTTLLLLAFFAALASSSWRIQEAQIYGTALRIQDFARTHPGIYAMGDSGGRIGYLLADPVIQTEGLVMDRNFLTLIQQQTPLRAALARYHVRYYIGTSFHPFTGCFQAIEPGEAGPNSPHMRDTFCEKPLAVIPTGDSVNNLIFDLQPQTPALAQAAAPH